MVYICGHKNPDSDSICSAYSYAQLHNTRADSQTAKALRCGPINRQTSYIFKKIGVEPPEYMKSIALNCGDVMNVHPDVVFNNAPLFDVFHLLDEKNANAVPVLSESREYLGLVNINILTKKFLAFGYGRTEIVFSPLNIAKVLQTQPLVTGNYDCGTFSLVIGALPLEGFSERLSRMTPEKVMLIAGEREDIIARAVDQKVAIIILTGVTDLKKKREVFAHSHSWVFASGFDTIETYRRLMLSMPVETVMSTGSPSLTKQSSLAEASAIFADHAVRGIPIIENNRFAGLVTRTDFLAPKRKKLILMDHNEFAQAIDGARDADVVEIIDHHRIGSLSTTMPIEVFAKPVGSTCTLVYEKFKMNQIVPSKQTAAILLAGIISDTLALRSPTAAIEDKSAVVQLSAIAHIDDWQEFANDIFANTQNLLFENAADVIKADLKTYAEKGWKTGISQVEVIDIDEVNEVRVAFARELESLRASMSLDWAMLLATDIVHGNSVLLTAGSEEADKRLRYTKTDTRFFALPGIMSRKKQLLPEVLRIMDEVALLK